MKPGDLVKFNRPTTKQEGKYFLVLEADICGWVNLVDAGPRNYHHEKDLVVVNNS